jgi:uncharacterized protein (DUF2126 family)
MCWRARPTPEWTTEALGTEKSRIGQQLAEKLLKRFAPHGVLQHGMGKWYPGEDLPRWALRCVWLDHEPVCCGGPTTEPKDFLEKLCHELKLNAHHIRRCHEHDAYILVMGYQQGQGWRSAPWLTEVELLPGEAPLGMRLPWSDLPDSHPAKDIGTALCVEPGLNVFLPPTPTAAAWLHLLQAVHRCAHQPTLHGYAPPCPGLADDGVRHLRQLSVTPDPGVIEVNLHPAQSWSELVDIVSGVDTDARTCGLVSHRFWRDGSVTGTGGGCHVVVGGPAPSQSPFANRPDLLRSILLFWNRHPALSYFFSGLFVGPTSQAPRADEARHDTLYELELAFRELDTEQASDPAMLGRIFRDLLVDVSGNGHRSEICVDKLFDPLAPGGQQGLLEFRALEMAPHPQMNLATMLLLRGLLHRLATTPEEGSLHRFGTELHDRYMLPTFLWQDLESVLQDLREHGLHFQSEWFRPHFEFRFPLLGSCRCDGVLLQLRTALEPWPALGEQTSATSRRVDSSVQRVEVRLSGLDPRTQGVACNGHFLPLHPLAGDLGNGEFVAGVRFRAWQFSHILHPTLGVQSPLQFDLVELATGISRGSCRYHTMRPDGEQWTDFPVNAAEAEKRRFARFVVGVAGGECPWAHPLPNPEYPLTLDLRRESLPVAH